MVKIRVSGPWDKPENILNRLLQQFTTEDIDFSNVTFVTDDSYDIAVFFNYIDLEVPEDKKIFVFPHEPLWNGQHQKNYSLFKNIKVFGFNKESYTPPESCTPTIAHTFYGGRGPWVDKLEDWNYKNLININPKKSKTISSILTNNINAQEFSNKFSLYKCRYNLAKYLISNASFIDYYGGWGLKTSEYKKSTVENYMFNISIENEFSPNWISEKFYDPILYNTIPIYYGCPNIKEYYPEKGYILLEDPFDTQRTLKQIKNIQSNAKDIYKEMLPNLLKIKQKYFNQYNLLKKIIKLANQ